MYTIQVGQSDPQPVRAQLTHFHNTGVRAPLEVLGSWPGGERHIPELHQDLSLMKNTDITVRLVGREWLRLLQAGKKVETRKVGVCTANSDAHHKTQLPSEHHISVVSTVPMFDITGTISLQVLPQNVMMRQVELVPCFLFIWRIKGVYWE